MKLAIMQPYFMPYIGYFSLIKHTDEFILFDTVQFIRHGWIERNRILKPDGGWQYIKVPLIKQSRETLIKDMIINNNEKWKQRILSQLEHYKKKAPYYNATINLMNEIFKLDYDNIAELNLKSLQLTCSYLGLERTIKMYSDMDLTIDSVHAPDEWALNICKAIKGADYYLNPEGGLAFFDTTKYRRAGIKIAFQKMNLQSYPQITGDFESGLSIIDVMMFNNPEEILNMLDQYILLE